MSERRTKRLKDEFRDLVASFLEQESSRVSLVTVTHTELVHEGKIVQCYISVFPEDKEKQALDFAKRKTRELRNFVASKTKMKFVPRFTFVIDQGERNRQRIEELLKKGARGHGRNRTAV